VTENNRVGWGIVSTMPLLTMGGGRAKLELTDALLAAFIQYNQPGRRKENEPFEKYGIFLTQRQECEYFQ